MASQPSQEAQHDRMKKSCRTNGQLPSRNPVDWTDIHQSALETLIGLITSAPVMAYPDFQKLHTDASKDGLGAVLYQYQDEALRVVAYGSRSLTPAEKNYHLH